MSSLYSTSFIKAHGGATPSYTVPDGFIAVIRCITVTNNSGIGIPEGGSVYLGHSSVTIVNVLLSALIPTSPGNSFVWNGRVVVEATDTINVTSSSDVDISVSGYLLSAP